ncbi:MAG: hypothetical protein R2734_14095 [Nocardioides sp.]
MPKEADKTTLAAAELGIAPAARCGTTSRARRHSTWAAASRPRLPLSGWTPRSHRHGFVSGVYSSAGSGIKMLDDARVARPAAFHLPDCIWIARWTEPPTSTPPTSATTAGCPAAG